MKTKINDKIIKVRKPISKQLYQWVTKIDLKKWNIILKDPVGVRNFISQYSDYMRDLEQFKVAEYWQDPEIILNTRNDDCEGINNLTCNILFSLGYDCRLSLGRYDTKNFLLCPSERYMNHAYGLLYMKDDFNPYIIDCTGNDLITELPRIDDHPEYYTWWTGSGIFQKDFICNHLVEMENL